MRIQICEALKGVTMVRRLKLLFIGPGGVGKTSVIRRLQNSTFVDGLPATDGVCVATLQMGDSKGRERTEVHALFLCQEMLRMCLCVLEFCR